MHSTARTGSGVPDIIGCYHGRFFAFEVKTAVGRLTAIQMHTLAEIHRAGGVEATVTSAQDAINLTKAKK